MSVTNHPLFAGIQSVANKIDTFYELMADRIEDLAFHEVTRLSKVYPDKKIVYLYAMGAMFVDVADDTIQAHDIHKFLDSDLQETYSVLEFIDEMWQTYGNNVMNTVKIEYIPGYGMKVLTDW